MWKFSIKNHGDRILLNSGYPVRKVFLRLVEWHGQKQQRDQRLSKIVLVSLLFYGLLFEEEFSLYFSRIKSLNASI